MGKHLFCLNQGIKPEPEPSTDINRFNNGNPVLAPGYIFVMGPYSFHEYIL